MDTSPSTQWPTATTTGRSTTPPPTDSAINTHVSYIFWKTQSKSRLMMVTPAILTFVRKIMMIKMSSKFKYVLDGFSCNKYPCIIYFWKSWSNFQIDDGDSSHLDIHQEDHDDQDVLQTQG